MTEESGVVQRPLEAGPRTENVVVASGSFPGDDTRITPDNAFRLVKYCKRGAAVMSKNTMRSEVVATSIDQYLPEV